MSHWWLDWDTILCIPGVGLSGILCGWWLWRYSASIQPGSYIYRLFEVYHLVLHWGHHADFDKIADRYIRRQAKHSILVGVLIVILGILLGIVDVFAS